MVVAHAVFVAVEGEAVAHVGGEGEAHVNALVIHRRFEHAGVVTAVGQLGASVFVDHHIAVVGGEFDFQVLFAQLDLRVRWR